MYEFIELQNTGATAIDIGSWTVSGGIEFTFPIGRTIAAGGFRVVAKNPARLATVYGLSTATVLGPYTGKLGNSGDTVRVKNVAGETIDSLTYSSNFPWPISANALGAQDRFTGLSSASYQYKGRSLQRVSVTANSNDPANWLASPLTPGPSPGSAQAVTRSVPKPVGHRALTCAGERWLGGRPRESDGHGDRDFFLGREPLTDATRILRR